MVLTIFLISSMFCCFLCTSFLNYAPSARACSNFLFFFVFVDPGAEDVILGLDMVLQLLEEVHKIVTSGACIVEIVLIILRVTI